MPTLLGNPTPAELDELIAAKDATLAAIDAAAVKTLPTWDAVGHEAADAWRVQWRALLARYNAARALRAARPRSLAVPPEVAWHAILHALRAAWDPTGSLTQAPPETAGDLSDLSRRITTAGAKPDFSGVPQPVATDPELAMFEAAGVVVRAAEWSINFAPLLLLFLASQAFRGRD